MNTESETKILKMSGCQGQDESELNRASETLLASSAESNSTVATPNSLNFSPSTSSSSSTTGPGSTVASAYSSSEFQNLNPWDACRKNPLSPKQHSRSELIFAENLLITEGEKKKHKKNYLLR